MSFKPIAIKMEQRTARRVGNLNVLLEGIVPVRLLVDQQIPPTRLSAVGYADTRPIAPGTDPVSLARNRRVTLSLHAIGNGALE